MDQLKSKLDELHALQDPIEKRINEFERRPGVLNHLKTSITLSKDWVSEAKKNFTTEPEDDHIFTEDQIGSVEAMANATQVWLDDLLTQQEKLQNHDNPVLLSDDMISRGEKLDKLLLSMERKRKLWKPKKVVKEETTATSDEEDDDAEEEETVSVENDDEGKPVTKTKKVYKPKTKKSKKTEKAQETTIVTPEEPTETVADEQPTETVVEENKEEEKPRDEL